MKLVITRNQEAKKGLLGGHKGMAFRLTCRVSLTPEEQKLISTYRAENEALTYTTVSSGTRVPDLKIGDLVKGVSYELSDIFTLLKGEETIKGACKSFKEYLMVMASFGGEEVLEF